MVTDDERAATGPAPMRPPVCAACGTPGVALCYFHLMEADAPWAEGNRAICDFIHRGRVRPAAACPA